MNDIIKQLNDQLATYGGALATEQPPSRPPQQQTPSRRPPKAGSEAEQYRLETERLRREQGMLAAPPYVEKQLQGRQKELERRRREID